jgi:hypothetical protein
MRKLVTALASLAVVFLLIPSIGLAIEIPVESGVAILGILSTDDIGTAENYIETAPSGLFSIYFYIFNKQISGSVLGGAEFHWWFEGGTAPILLEAEWPSRSLVLTDPQNSDPMNVVVGFGDGVPTVDGHARIMKANLFYGAPPTVPVYIRVGQSWHPTIPGEMAYNDWNNAGDIRVMRPNTVGGLYDADVFGFNVTVATQGETWGAVKSLFR